MPASSPSMAQKTAFFTFSPWGRGTSIRFMKAAEPTSTWSPGCWRRGLRLIAAQAVRPAEDGPLGAEQVVEELFQPTARVPDQGGGVATTRSTEKSPKTLMPLSSTKPGGNRSRSVMRTRLPRRDPAAPGQPAQGTAALGDPAGHLVEGAAIGQCPAEAGGGSEGGGETPHQVLPSPMPKEASREKTMQASSRTGQNTR